MEDSESAERIQEDAAIVACSAKRRNRKTCRTSRPAPPLPSRPHKPRKNPPPPDPVHHIPSRGEIMAGCALLL